MLKQKIYIYSLKEIYYLTVCISTVKNCKVLLVDYQKLLVD